MRCVLILHSKHSKVSKSLKVERSNTNLMPKTPQTYQITEGLWTELKQNTLTGINRLLQSSETLLETNPQISAGLYTYAVEEYGKLLVLKNSKPDCGQVWIDEEKLFKGRRTHDYKFREAIKNLPMECTSLSGSTWDTAIWDDSKWDEETTLANFKARMAIFYCGLDESRKVVTKVPDVSKTKLKVAIEKLGQIVSRC